VASRAPKRGAQTARRVVTRSEVLDLRKQRNRATGLLLQQVQREMGLSQRPTRVSLSPQIRSTESQTEPRSPSSPNRRVNFCAREMEPLHANARYRLGKLSSDGIVALANAWLNQGIYSDSLAQLYSIAKPEMADVGPLFESAMKQLGIVALTRIEAAMLLTKDTLQQVSSGEVNPVEGAEFLYWHVHCELSAELPDSKYVGDSLGLERVFCWLREIWDCRDGSMILYYTDLPRDQAEKKFIEHLIEAAKEWKQPNHTTMPSSLPRSCSETDG